MNANGVDRIWNVHFGPPAHPHEDMLDLKRDKALARPVKHALETPYTYNELFQKVVSAE